MQVSFVANDTIINATPQDDTWLTGTVERTGQTGLLPRNFVEVLGTMRQVRPHCVP